MSGADYCPNSPEEVRLMLDAVGVADIDDLFRPISPALRAKSFNLPPGMSEFEMLHRFQTLAGRNAQGLVHFVGGGFHDHLIPAVVDHLASRPEFYTAYTPYQPECSQGTLQALFEYQTAICRLTGMEVANASLYDGGTALAEAALMALRITGRSRLVVDGAVNPFHREILATYLANLDVELVEIAPKAGMEDDVRLRAAVDDATAAVIVQNPDFFGTLSDLSGLAAEAHGVGALLVASVYPISLGIVRSPGSMGADIVVGDGQSLGNPLSFGGPSFGFIAGRREHIRNLPGRIIGETVDRNGTRGFVLTLQAREQHIKRHKATSNICSNQSLCALRGLIFLSALGSEGMAELARLNRDKAEYAKAVLGAVPGVEVLNSGFTFNEFTVCLPKTAEEAVVALLRKGVAAGVPLSPYYPDMEKCMVVTVTEKRTKAEIDTFARQLEGTLWN